jgi:hypothetical protein
MSTPWQCAVCEAINDGGDTCSACGATVVRRATRATPIAKTPAPETPTREDRETEVPVRELPVREPAIERTFDPGDDLYDYFGVEGPADADDRYEVIDTRPRVRVYGCCLPIALGMLLALLGAVTLLANLFIGAL